MSIKLIVNGQEIEETVPDNTTLLEFLKTVAKVNSVKSACHGGDCGLCTVLVDDVPVKSCLMLVKEVANSRITTVEGMKDDPVAIVLRKTFEKNGASQCGYCTPSFLLVSIYLLRTVKKTNVKLTKERIVDAINGLLCRCTGYVQIIDAILEAASEI